MPLMLVILPGVRPAVVHAPERPSEITAAYIQRYSQCGDADEEITARKASLPKWRLKARRR